MKNESFLKLSVLFFLIFYIGISCKKKEPETPSVTDVDGNVYPVIELGTQIWMAENLKTTRYNDNSDIPLITSNTNWAALTTPGYCWYNNDEAANKPLYGALYNWYTVNTGKLCPIGWHVPSDADFAILESFLGDVSIVGGMLKESGNDHWFSPNTGADNSSGFTALPSGYRADTGEFGGLNQYALWWTSTPYNSIKPWYRSTGYQTAGIERRNGNLNQRGFSIRCVRD